MKTGITIRKVLGFSSRIIQVKGERATLRDLIRAAHMILLRGRDPLLTPRRCCPLFIYIRDISVIRAIRDIRVVRVMKVTLSFSLIIFSVVETTLMLTSGYQLARATSF